MTGWHHQLNGHEFEQTPGDGDGQGSLDCCSSWGHKELDTTEWLNNNNYRKHFYFDFIIWKKKMYCSGFLNTAFCSWGTGFETGVGLHGRLHVRVRLHGRQPCWESCWWRRAWRETQAHGFLTGNVVNATAGPGSHALRPTALEYLIFIWTIK